METIQPGKFVQLAYEIFAVDDEGEELMFKFTDDKPESFVFGNDPWMLPKFLEGIAGLKPGDKFDIRLTPDQAFGPRDPQLCVEVPRDKFCVDGEFDSENVYQGAVLNMRFEDGSVMPGIVASIDEQVVVMDFNHELAGETVRYAGHVITVRDATPEELAPQHHCGCGCGHDHGSEQGCDGCSGCH